MEKLIGHVTHYYNHLGVAVIILEDELKVGDTLLFLGHTTDLNQIACSIEVEHHKLVKASRGMTVAVAVDEPVRIDDKVYKLVEGAENPQNILIWNEMRRALDEIQHTYEPVFSHFMHANGVDDHVIGILLAAVTFDPGTISPERLQVRGPYTSTSAWMERLFRAAEKGYLSEPEPGEFRLSRRGQTVTQRLIREAREAMQHADPLTYADSRRLAELLRRLVQSSLFTSPPPDTWSIRLAYQLMPVEEPPFPYIDQALSCLQAYRDDAHLAAWQPSGLSAPALEALTFIWRGEASSLESIYDRLAFRGFELHDYQAAVDDLRQRNLLEGDNSSLQMTAVGKVFRDQVEQDTNNYFFASWSCLSSADKTELACLLTTLRNRLSHKTPA